MSGKVRLENGKLYSPKDSDPVDCPVHDFHTTWGALDPIQQLAIAEGLDTTKNMPCIMAPRGDR